MKAPGQLFFAEVMGRSGKWSSLHSVDKAAWAKRENHLYKALCSEREPISHSMLQSTVLAVASEFHVTALALRGKSRSEPIATARMLAIYLLFLRGFSYPPISKYLRRSIQACTYARCAIRERLTVDANLRQRVQRLAETLNINPGDSGATPP
jgi:chromosomal replication initiation ATPase DnaA